ncbi:MAG: triose-phosphate isomerase [Planctomycetota bacterium]
MARTPIVGGNWKMNTDLASGGALASGVSDAVGDGGGVDVVVFPPFPYLAAVGQVLSEHGTSVKLGAQDVWHEANGAFTGEISLEMLKDCGVSSVLVGHSERRHVIGETDDLIASKTRAVLGSGLQCVLCIGEKLEEREAGSTDAVNERQLRSALEGVAEGQLANLVVAYEPVWAIGTGKTATPEDAQDAHAAVRGVLGSLFGADQASGIRIQYGGSMKPGNASELMAQPDIDGGLIGGASLKAGDFSEIVRLAGN